MRRWPVLAPRSARVRRDGACRSGSHSSADAGGRVARAQQLSGAPSPATQPTRRAEIAEVQAQSGELAAQASTTCRPGRVVGASGVSPGTSQPPGWCPPVCRPRGPGNTDDGGEGQRSARRQIWTALCGHQRAPLPGRTTADLQRHALLRKRGQRRTVDQRAEVRKPPGRWLRTALEVAIIPRTRQPSCRRRAGPVHDRQRARRRRRWLADTIRGHVSDGLSGGRGKWTPPRRRLPGRSPRIRPLGAVVRYVVAAWQFRRRQSPPTITAGWAHPGVAKLFKHQDAS